MACCLAAPSHYLNQCRLKFVGIFIHLLICVHLSGNNALNGYWYKMVDVKGCLHCKLKLQYTTIFTHIALLCSVFSWFISSRVIPHYSIWEIVSLQSIKIYQDETKIKHTNPDFMEYTKYEITQCKFFNWYSSFACRWYNMIFTECVFSRELSLCTGIN